MRAQFIVFLFLASTTFAQAGEIDLNRAYAAKDRAEKRLIEKESIDLARAKASLMRAMNRIKIATRS